MTPSQIGTLKEQVKLEAAALKQHATPSELANLDFNRFNANRTSQCIYGQMTGNCYSNRANELIVQCAQRVYTTDSGCLMPEDIENLNGKPHLLEGRTRKHYYHSPIELFVAINQDTIVKTLHLDYNQSLVSANTKILLEYLQGHTETLNFI